jgi:CheY-like chemotaxis protein
VAIKKVLWSEAVRSKVEAGKAHFLARASVRALTAGTSSLFLEIAASERPDLIILPIEPMEESASDLCRRLREEAGARPIPILALAAPGADTDRLRDAGCGQIVDLAIAAEALQETITRMLGVRLRRHARFPVVLPVARGRIFHEFLGYTNSVSEGGMGFETISRIRIGERLPLRIYRNTEEKPITVTGRVAGVRPNIETGIGYAVGVEFLSLAATDRGRLLEIFPRDPTYSWGPDPPSGPTDGSGSAGSSASPGRASHRAG